MYKLAISNRFKSSWKNYKHNKKTKDRLDNIIEMLCSGLNVPAKYRDHKLQGEFAEYRELHLYPDVLLVYKINKKIAVVTLSDIGSHSELFG